MRNKHLPTVLLLARCILLFFIPGCHKTDHLQHNVAPPTDAALTEQFFTISGEIDPAVSKVINKLRRRPEGIASFVRAHGLAKWDKALVFGGAVDNGPVRNTTSAVGGNAAGNGNTEKYKVLIPLVAEGDEQVKSMLACSIKQNDSMFIMVMKAGDYKWYTEHAAQTGLDGKGLSLLLMKLDQKVFGHSRFKITDTSLFRTGDKLATRVWFDSLPAAPIPAKSKPRWVLRLHRNCYAV